MEKKIEESEVISSKYTELQLNYQRLNEIYSQTAKSNSFLLEEQKKIQASLLNVDIENVDERSDMKSSVYIPS